MCENITLKHLQTQDMTFPPEAGLIPEQRLLQGIVIAPRVEMATQVMDAMEKLLGKTVINMKIGGDFNELDAHKMTQLSDAADVLLIAGNLMTWENNHLLTDIHCPVMIVDPPLVFHPYQAALRHFFKQQGNDVLPAENHQRVRDSMTALQAKVWLSQSKAILVNEPDDKHPMRGDVATRGQWFKKKTGVNVISIPVSRLKILAAQISIAQAQQVWEHWQEHLISEVDPALSQEHLMQIAQLYLAMRKIAEEQNANGISVQEFEPFLFKKKTMPNVAYAALRSHGITTAEEGDLNMLVTQLLLASTSKQQAMMANVYMAYRDAWEANGKTQGQAADELIADFQQSLDESTVMLCHFATAGIMPRCMTDEDKYRVVQTLPCWPGQSMVFTHPKLGDAVLARLDEENDELHVYTGRVTKTYDDPDGGWYQGRWLMQLDDIDHFVDHAFHAHYAVSMNQNLFALKTVCDLSGLTFCLHDGK